MREYLRRVGTITLPAVVAATLWATPVHAYWTERDIGSQIREKQIASRGQATAEKARELTLEFIADGVYTVREQKIVKGHYDIAQHELTMANELRRRLEYALIPDDKTEVEALGSSLSFFNIQGFRQRHLRNLHPGVDVEHSNTFEIILLSYLLSPLVAMAITLPVTMRSAARK